MMSRSESAGMNQPSSVTPSIAGKNTSSYSMPYSSGRLKIGVRAECAIMSARPSMNCSVLAVAIPGVVSAFVASVRVSVMTSPFVFCLGPVQLQRCKQLDGQGERCGLRARYGTHLLKDPQHVELRPLIDDLPVGKAI